jgi:sulfate-transporting ATPase
MIDDRVAEPPAGPLTLQRLALGLVAAPLRAAGDRLESAERAMHDAERRGKFSSAAAKTQLAYADAIAAWGEAGGYDAEVLFDTVSVGMLDLPWEAAKTRPVHTLSGGQQKRFALDLLLRGSDDVLLLDEPDNFLDVPGKRWLEARLNETAKSVLYVSHDRELLARTAGRVVAVEGGSAWVHPGGFASWHDARVSRHERLEERRRRWDEERAKLRELMFMYKQKAAYNSDMASRRRSRRSGCGWPVGAPASGRSSANDWSWTA